MKRPAFTLTEVAVALAIFAFSATLLFALLPLSIKQSKNSRHEIAAMMLMEQLEGDLRETATSGTTSELFDIPIPKDSNVKSTLYFSQSQKNVTRKEDAYYRIECDLRHEAKDNMAKVSMRAFWPAAAPIGREQGTVELFTFISDKL